MRYPSGKRAVLATCPKCGAVMTRTPDAGCVPGNCERLGRYARDEAPATLQEAIERAADVKVDGRSYRKHDVTCGECGKPMKLRPSRHGIFYGCTGFPECKGTHGAHKGTGEPLGIHADKATRYARIRAHRVFDDMWRGDGMSRGEAYKWLAKRMGRAVAHIGEMTVAECSEVERHVMAHRRGVADATGGAA